MPSRLDRLEAAISEAFARAHPAEERRQGLNNFTTLALTASFIFRLRFALAPTSDWRGN